MAIVEVKILQFSESVEEGMLVSWKKRPGEAVIQDEILTEVEIDRVMLEVPASSAGMLAGVPVADGATMMPEQLLAKIDTEGETGAVAPVAAAPAPVVVAPAPAAAAPAAAVAGGVTMPSVAKLMAENNLSAGQVTGTGRNGRITKGDVLGAVAGSVKPAAAAVLQAVCLVLQQVAAPVDFVALGDRPEECVPMSRLHARIVERLVQPQLTNVIPTTFDEVNMELVMDLRVKFKDQFEKTHSVRPGFMSFLVKAVVYALKKYPIINASVDGNDIVYHGYFDIGIAVDSPRGLVVPILRNVDQTSLADIEKKIAEFGQKAKDGKLTLDDLTGGMFSIPNGGTFGPTLSILIVNPPQSATLGAYVTKDRAMVENGQVVIRPMNYLAISYDHCIIDGREAVLGLVAMKEALEDPARLPLDP